MQGVPGVLFLPLLIVATGYGVGSEFYTQVFMVGHHVSYHVSKCHFDTLLSLNRQYNQCRSFVGTWYQSWGTNQIIHCQDRCSCIHRPRYQSFCQCKIWCGQHHNDIRARQSILDCASSWHTQDVPGLAHQWPGNCNFDV